MFLCSGGARMQEALFSLMQMAKLVPYLLKCVKRCAIYFSINGSDFRRRISQFCDVRGFKYCRAKSLNWFAGPRVIEQTVREKLPEGFQRSEFLLEKGQLI